MDNFSWQLLAGFALHLVFDLGWQGKQVAFGKKGVNPLMLYHAGKTSFFTLAPFLTFFNKIAALPIAWLLLTSTHILIDNLKIFAGKKFKVQYADYNWFWKLIALDQAAHWLVFYLTTSLFFL